MGEVDVAGYDASMVVHSPISPTVATSTAAPLELVIADVPATPSRAGAVRHAVASWLDAAAIDSSRRPDVELAVYEALANTVEHAYRDFDVPGTFTVRAAFSALEQTLEVAVVDHGRWRPPTPNPMRGNGLPLISAVTSVSSVAPSSEGTSVVMRWDAAALAGAV
ncbi:hypothetical protein RhoFasB10_00901 [Rhodococcus sp. B10]|nr:hypothetical protein [Rhodococcus sp. B10]